MLSCSSRWQPPQRRQLPAVSSHINPRGGIRAKWLLLRGDGLDSHGPSQQPGYLSQATLSQPRRLSVPSLYRFWNQRAVRRLRRLPTHLPHDMSIFHAHDPRGGHKYCYLHLIRRCCSKGELVCSRGNDNGFKAGDSEVI